MDIAKGTILLVDDSQTIRAVIGQQLRNAGFEPLFAATGAEGLALLQHETVDAVLLDINLPDMDGHEVCRRAKSHPRTHSIPVIVLTSLNDTETELSAIDAGADDYIPKPPQPRVLDARLRMHIKRARRERCSNPLTGLPGNVVIEQELASRFNGEHDVSLAYIDLDDFKSYNDRYGYQRGDSVILLAASVLANAIAAQSCAPDDFLGHVGGDDFVLLSRPCCIEAIAQHAITAFDEAIGAFYDDETRERGWFEAVDRRGASYHVPIMSMSIASVDRDDMPFETSLEMIDDVTELKHVAKSTPGSVHVHERRHTRKPCPTENAAAG